MAKGEISARASAVSDESFFGTLAAADTALKSRLHHGRAEDLELRRCRAQARLVGNL
jgi:hypothetical protein